jgi:DNA-directed RNA polymerase subunit RPC12/RpoP
MPDIPTNTGVSGFAADDLQLVARGESTASYAGKLIGENALAALFGDIFDADPIRATVLSVVDRRTTDVITQVKGITFQRELDDARQRFTRELTTLSTNEFKERYQGRTVSDTTHWFRVHRCEDCGRDFAGSELRANTGDRCPACADDRLRRSLRRFIHPQARVAVPDHYFLVRCVQSFQDHDWRATRESELEVKVQRVARSGKTIVVELGNWLQRE